MAQVIATLKNIHLFDGLDDRQLDQVAAFVRPVSLKEGEPLPLSGKDDPFFILVSGQVRLANTQRGGASYVLRRGDFFGAESIFHGKNRSYDLVALKPALLYRFELISLRAMLNNLPIFTKNVKKQLTWYNLIRSKAFSWLGEAETVKLICRKHPAYLFVLEIFPLVIAWIGILVILFATQISTTSFRLAVGWFGAGTVGGAVLWAVWRFFDWGNDYYIVTDERIVWLERTIAIYDSRQEAPLVAIKSGETKSTLAGRWLGYGDVITQTFMGQIYFRHIRNPGEIKNLIDQERKAALERQMSTDVHVIEGKIRQKIEPSGAV
ncbi:MAG: cyclic nucleotide-binding domain-containing protein, partial [Acidobacteriaceae bacterium]